MSTAVFRQREQDLSTRGPPSLDFFLASAGSLHQIILLLRLLNYSACFNQQPHDKQKYNY